MSGIRGGKEYKEEGRAFPSSYILLLTMIALVHCGHDNIKYLNCRVNIQHYSSLTELLSFSLRVMETTGSLPQTQRVSTNNYPARNTGKYSETKFSMLYYYNVHTSLLVNVTACNCFKHTIIS